jgi:hypothetical protein
MLMPKSVVDPSIFQKGEEMMFEASIINAAWELEQAHEELKRREVPDQGAQTMAMYNELKEEMKEPDDYSGEDVLEQVFGDELESMLGYITAQPVKRINDQGEILPSEEQEITAAKERAGIKLVDLTCGYQHYIETSMIAVGMDVGGAHEDAWAATWRRLHTMLSGEGTLLAEVVGYYDEVARDTFGNHYQPMEENRGEVVNRDVCASTFYKVMGKHIPRAIIGRARDEWTGY